MDSFSEATSGSLEDYELFPGIFCVFPVFFPSFSRERKKRDQAKIMSFEEKDVTVPPHIAP
ncbi:MAG: hypothetical protein OEZ36_06855 [Spirochaetota bacterium]|nr:hypothetical protein [Spirochaetota bacterium]